MTPSSRAGRRAGFTLIEVLLVLVILVILGSLAVTAYGPMRKKAQIDAARAAISMFETPLEAYHLHMDAYPSDLNGLREAHYASPGTHNPDSYDLWSVGPDGADGTADDIGNWASE